MCTQLGGGKVTFETRYDSKICEEDAGFQTATPWGEVVFAIDNPKAIAQLEVGKHYYFDVTPSGD
jgi:hypothetical protein